MSYRKLKADFLFTGHTMLNAGKVLIVKPDGEIVSIVNENEAGDNIENYSGVISPGFINAHCHLELSHMKGLIAERTGLVDFVYKVVNERNFPEEEILHAIAKEEAQMKQKGIVAVGDICNNQLTISQKLKQNLYYCNFIEVSGWTPSMAKLRLDRSKSIYSEFVNNNLSASLVPHAPYSVSEDLWQQLSPYFKGKVITIHNQETNFENELFLHGTGDLLRMYKKMGIDNSFYIPAKKTSLQTFFNRLAGATSAILVHNTFTRQADIDFVNENRQANQVISFCLCPNANLYIENTLPPVELLQRNNCLIVLGTDSIASNHTLDILEEIKTILNTFPAISLEKALQWATLNGAKALQLDEFFGSFDKGKKPGVVLIENVNEVKLTSRSISKRLI